MHSPLNHPIDDRVIPAVENERQLLAQLALRVVEADTNEALAEALSQTCDRFFEWDSFFFEERVENSDFFQRVFLMDTVGGVRMRFGPDEESTAVYVELKELYRGEPILINREPDAGESGRSAMDLIGNLDRRSASLMYAPIAIHGELAGVISVQSYEFNRYTKSDLDLLKSMADLVAPAMRRNLAELALRRNEQRYRRAIAQANAIPYEKDYSTLEFKYLGEGIQTITGYSPQELTRDVWRSMLQEIVLHGEMAGLELNEAIDKSRRGELRSWTADCRIRTRSGEERWVADSSIQLQDEQGKPYGSLGILQDITERKRTETELARLASFPEMNPTPIVEVAESGEVIYLNPAASETFPDLKALGTDHPFLKGLNDEAGWILQGDQSIKVRELKLGEIWYQQILHPVHYHQPVLRLYSTEITKLKEFEYALRVSEERYALAARGSNEGLWDWHVKSDRIYYSPRWKKILGYRDSEIGPEIKEWLDRVHPDERPHVQLEMRRHLDGQTGHFQSEHRLRHRDGDYRWVLTRGLAVRNPEGEVVRMAGSLTDITDRRNTEDQLVQAAFYDPLTELPNRALFFDRLGRCLARSHRKNDYRFALLFLDLDRFKTINDSLGHLTGDKLLKHFGERLMGIVREGDTVARLGGDEFTILLDDIKDSSEAIAIGDRILEEVKQPFHIDGRDVFSEASIGIAVSAGEYDRAEDVLRDADIALYRAKENGRARFVVYNREMHESVANYLKIENELRSAVRNNEFDLVYQPIFETRTRKLHGIEALARWNSPGNGVVMPETFIPVAEETGLIVPIGKWVLHEALSRMADWKSRFPKASDCLLSINVSPRQFCGSDIRKDIATLLEETGLDPSTLLLEITESAILTEPGKLNKLLGDWRLQGIRILLDDFGTGYSPLGHLIRLPVDSIKIDRSFVRDMQHDKESAHIVQAITSLAEILGLSVIAEGAESAEQVETLAELGCDYVQGFFFSKPLKAAQVEDMLK